MKKSPTEAEDTPGSQKSSDASQVLIQSPQGENMISLIVENSSTEHFTSHVSLLGADFSPLAFEIPWFW